MRTAGLAITTLFLCISIASAAQEVQHFELSLNGAGAFSKSTGSTTGTVSDTPTKSVAVFGTVQYHFTRMHAVELNIGHTNDSQVFLLAPNTYRIRTAITEFSGAYIFSPFAPKKIEPFLLGGMGGLRFSPGTTYIDGFQASFGAVQRTSLAFLYGGGVDYHLWRGLALKLQYRGFIYKVPDFNVQSLFTGARGHIAEPSLGLAIRF